VDVFPLPKNAYTKTSGYRTPHRPLHNGIDYGAPEGTPIYAVADGIVYVPQPEPYGAGINAWLKTEAGAWWKFFHLANVVAHNGQQVRAGDVIASVGHTGHVEPPGVAGAHLHIERHQNGPSNPTDPTAELDAAERKGRWVDEYPAPESIQPEDTMNEADREWFTQQLANHRHEVERQLNEIRTDSDRNVVLASANMARVNHWYLEEIAGRLGVGPLPEFTVNVDTLEHVEPTAPEPGPVPPPEPIPGPVANNEGPTIPAAEPAEEPPADDDEQPYPAWTEEATYDEGEGDQPEPRT
jgi:hypothetical protein